MVHHPDAKPARRPPASRKLAPVRVADADLAFALRNTIPRLPRGDQDAAWALVHSNDRKGVWTLDQHRMAKSLLARGRCAPAGA